MACVGGLTGDVQANEPGPLPSYRGSNKKAKKNVDEWSVLTLYNDVVHFEEQKGVKVMEHASKAKTRQTLLGQVGAR